MTGTVIESLFQLFFEYRPRSLSLSLSLSFCTCDHKQNIRPTNTFFLHLSLSKNRANSIIRLQIPSQTQPV